MDMMDIRRRMMTQMGIKLPDFINNIEFGSFTLDTAPTNGQYNIQLQKIADPKVILIYNNDFNCYDAKADKPMLGAYSAIWVKPNDFDSKADTTNEWYILSTNSFYFVNWGQNTDNKSAVARNSRTESRGLYLFKPSTKTLRISGLNSSQSEYDFKLGVTYHWVVIE